VPVLGGHRAGLLVPGQSAPASYGQAVQVAVHRGRGAHERRVIGAEHVPAARWTDQVQATRLLVDLLQVTRHVFVPALLLLGARNVRQFGKGEYLRTHEKRNEQPLAQTKTVVILLVE